MGQDKIDEFKSVASNYLYYKHKQRELLSDIEKLEYDMTGVKGVRYDQTTGGGSYNESKATKRFIAMSDELERLEKELNRITEQINYVDATLNKMSKEMKDAFIRIYIKGQRYEDVANDGIFYSPSSLHYNINKELQALL